MNNTNLTSNRSVGMATIGVALLLVIIAFTAPACSQSVGTGDDSIRLRSFLEVTYPGDSWSVSDEPAAKVTNVGPEATEVQFFRFTLIADDDVSVDVPENCNVMYEDMVSEMILVVSCTGLWLEQNEELTMNFPVTGPWHMLELTSIYSRNELGETVYNDISADHPMMWFNQNY